MATFTWLHLTDMHVGQRDYGYDVRLVIQKLLEDLKQLVEGVGLNLRPDAILFTGDLSFSGTEYFPEDIKSGNSVEFLLSQIFEQWPWPDSRPSFAPVPGNHDLVWQPLNRDELKLWECFHDPDRVVRDQFFATQSDSGQGPYWLFSRVKKAFQGYESWLERTKLPRVDFQRIGRLPGDYVASIESPSGARVGLLALNSAFYDLPELRGRERPERLALDPEQLAALNVVDWYQEHHVCIAMTHHPPNLIHEGTREQIFAQYFLPDQIALHLCGHLHEEEPDRYGKGWEDGTLIFQGRSLFGVENDGAGPSQPSFGYALGQFSFKLGESRGELRIYPRRATIENRQLRFKTVGPINFGVNLPPKEIRVRPLAVPTKPPQSIAGLLEGTADEVLRALMKPDGHSVFLSGPPRYGKTAIVQMVEHRLPGERLVIHRDLTQIKPEKRSNAEEVARFLIKGIAPAFRRQPADFHDLGACLNACLGDSHCVLVVDSYHLLKPGARRGVAEMLRHCMEAYRSNFRILLLSQRPLEIMQPKPHRLEPSTFQTMLREINLKAIGAPEFRAWASRQERLLTHLSLVDWIHRHTGGHPWLLSGLLKGLLALPASKWPARMGASDDQREQWLHAPEGPLAETIGVLRHGLRDIAPTGRKVEEMAWLGLFDSSGMIIPFVAKIRTVST